MDKAPALLLRVDVPRPNWRQIEMDCPEFWKIRSADETLRKKILCYCFPHTQVCPYYLCPCAVIPELLPILEESLDERDRLAEAFLPLYPAARATAKKRMGKHFKAFKYPTEEQLPGWLASGYQFLDLAPPKKLDSLYPALWRQEEGKFDALTDTLYREASRYLYKQLWLALSAVVVPLECEPPVAGHVRGKWGWQFRDFARLQPARNIARDETLDRLTADAEFALKGIVAPVARRSPEVRAYLRREIKAVMAAIEEEIQNV